MVQLIKKWNGKVEDTFVNFGRFKGQRFKDVLEDTKYCSWLASDKFEPKFDNQSELVEFVKAKLKIRKIKSHKRKSSQDMADEESE